MKNKIYILAIASLQLSLTNAQQVEGLVFTASSIVENLNVQNIDINWTTEYEFDLENFELVRSFDNYNFEEIFSIDACNCDTGQTYHFIDESIPIGNIYYKLIAKSLSLPISEIELQSTTASRLPGYIWLPLLNEEFDNSFVNYNQWLNSFPWARSLCVDGGNWELAYFTDGTNYDFSNIGKLNLRVKNEVLSAAPVPYLPPTAIIQPNLCGNWWTFDYTSGMVFSTTKYLYGIFEAKVKMPSGKGFWPAFWLHSWDNDTYPPSREIDIFECDGTRPYDIHWDLHCEGACPNGPSWTNPTAIGDWVNPTSALPTFNIFDWNTYGVVWTPQYISWYVNDHFFSTVSHSDFFDNPLAVILSIGISSGGFIDGPPDATTPFPSDLEIDYIRVYNKFFCDQDQSLCPLNDFTYFDDTTIPYKGYRNINFGDNSCGKYIIPSTKNNFDLYASEQINIENTEIHYGANFDCQIISCPTNRNANTYSSFTTNLNTINYEVSKKKPTIGVEAPKIYPTVTSNYVTVHAARSLLPLTVTVVSDLGQKVALSTIIDESSYLSLSDLEVGIYIISFSNSNSRFYEKIIKIR